MNTQGFPNLGNTCWLNSLLQLLLNNKFFCAALRRMGDGKRTRALKSLADSRGSLPDLVEILRACGQQGTPEDSHEAFMRLLNILHEENKVPIRTDTTMSQQVAKHSENFTSLPLALFQGVFRYENSDREEIFEPFTTFFLESSRDAVYDVQKQLAVTFRKREIVKVPALLMICFEQFSGEFSMISEFDLTDAEGKPCSYKCTGFVVHCGSSGGGHYFAVCKTGHGWMTFDDNSVMPYNPATVSLRGCTPRLVLFSRKG